MCTYPVTGIYCEFEKKRITQGLSVYKQKGKQSINGEKDAMNGGDFNFLVFLRP